MTTENSRKEGPIFVLGMLQRTGTNFLRDLLVAHPDCEGSEMLAEDYLVHYSELLEEYCDWVSARWVWQSPEDVQRLHADLLRSIGRGLCDFIIRAVGGPRPVLKTPSVRNVDLFLRLFDDSTLLILTRDGRSVVESGMRSFGWDFEEATRNWAKAADRVLDFETRMSGCGNGWKIVRYEDLVRDPAELRSVLTALGLDAEVYDFEAARNLPVRGSSSYRRDGGEVHWKPVERSADFRPLERWADWSRSRHERFNWLAGDQMRALGYELSEQEARGWWKIWNRGHDGRWLARGVRRRLFRWS